MPDVYFEQDCLLDLGDGRSTQGIDFENLNKIWLYNRIDAFAKDPGELRFREMKREINNLIKLTNEQDKIRSELRAQLNARLEYQLVHAEIEYLKYKVQHSNAASQRILGTLRLSWLLFLELLIRNGYQGEARFFWWVVIIVVVYALIYALMFGEEVSSYTTFNAGKENKVRVMLLKSHFRIEKFFCAMYELFGSVRSFLSPRALGETTSHAAIHSNS